MNQSRGASTAQISRKRKEREDFFLQIKGKQSHPKTTSFLPTAKPVESPVRSNRILAGYLAHEFLTKGTLLGQKFEPEKKTEKEKKTTTYDEVASLLKIDGAHIPGIVNPCQLAQWIQK